MKQLGEGLKYLKSVVYLELGLRNNKLGES